MKPAKAFEKVTRRIALAKLRASPKQWQTYLRQRAPWWQKVFITLLTPVVLIGTLLVLGGFPLFAGRSVLAQGGGAPQGVSCILVGIVAAIMIGHATWLVQELLSSRSLAIASQLPLSDRDYLATRLSAALRATSLFFLITMVFAAGVASEHWQDLTIQGCCLVFAVASLEWVILVAGTLIIAAYFPSAAKQEFVAKLVGWSFLTFVLVLVAQRFINLKQVVVAVHFIVPTGWPILILGSGVLSHHPRVWWLAGCVVLLAVWAWRGLIRLRQKYAVAEFAFGDGAVANASLSVEEPDFPGDDSDQEESLARELDPPLAGVLVSLRRLLLWLSLHREAEPEAELTREEAAELIRSRAFLEPFDWQNSRWLERLWSRVFNDRERLVAEVFCGGEPVWSHRLAVTLAQIALALACLLGVSSWLGRGLFAATGHVALGSFFGLMRGTWPAAVWKARTGQVCSVVGILPIQTFDMNRMSIVLGITRGLALVPLGFVLAVLGIYGVTGRWDLVTSAYYAAKSLLVFAALHHWWFVALLPVTSSAHWFHRIINALGVVLMMMLSLTGAGGLFIAADSEGWSVAAAALMFGTAALTHAWFQRCLRRGPFDFVANAQSFQMQQQRALQNQGTPTETW